MNSFWFCRSASVLVRGFHCAVRSHLRGSFRFFSSRQRKFTVNGALLAADNVHYKVDFGPQNEEILVPRVDEGAYVMLYGPRASGKSSRVNTLMEQLKERYVFLNTSFQRVTLHKGEDVFWHSFSRELIRINHDLNLPSLRSPTDFLDLFHQHPFGDKKVVLIIDEFDSLYRADDAVQDSLLNPLRGLKHARDKHPLHSVIAAGTFSILNIVGKSGSPFNVREAVETPEFSLEQTRELFGQWVEEQHVKLDPRVVEDIHERTSGHVGFTNFCAKVLDEQFQDREKSLEVWLPYAAERLPKQLTRYPTCEKLVNTLTASDDIAVAARDLLDVQLMGASEPLEFSGHNLKIARFLADEGAIRETSVSEFAIRSDLVRSLLQSRVLVVDRPSPPKEAFPIHETDGVWRVDVEKLLEISVKNVNKEKLMANSDGKMCRLPKSAGAGLSGPAEAFYHHELYKILDFWKPRTVVLGTEVKTTSSGMKCDLEIRVQGHPRTVIELMASGTNTDVDGHIKRAVEYAKSLSASEAWVVHFHPSISPDTYQPKGPTPEQIDDAKNRMISLHMACVYHSLDGEEWRVQLLK